MFTGIIQTTGKVISFTGNFSGGRFIIRTPISLSKIKMGESIAIDGCCLTVVSYQNRKLVFDVSDETIAKTTMAKYKKGTLVNIERAMKASDRFGGHFVLGHVDGVGKIINIDSDHITLKAPQFLMKYIIPKGSIAVDGISLTACEPKKNSFKLYIIPHTFKCTNLPYKKKGDLVNLEVDVLGKYIFANRESLIVNRKKLFAMSERRSAIHDHGSQKSQPNL